MLWVGRVGLGVEVVWGCAVGGRVGLGVGVVWVCAVGGEGWVRG